MSRDGSRATVRHVFNVAVDCRLLMLLRRWLHLRSSPTPSHTATHRRSTVAPAPPSPPPSRPPLITGDDCCRTLTTPSALTRHHLHRHPSDAAVPPIRHAVTAAAGPAHSQDMSGQAGTPGVTRSRPHTTGRHI
jgi:hypothetical protein